MARVVCDERHTPRSLGEALLAAVGTTGVVPQGSEDEEIAWVYCRTTDNLVAVRLTPDGEFVTRATCTNRAGNIGRSAEGRFTVDSVAPTLAVQSPMAGAVIGLSGDVNAAGRMLAVDGRAVGGLSGAERTRGLVAF